MSGQLFFSIVIPVYNRTAILLNTISTICKQTFEAFEIIIVDDGSTEDLLATLSAVPGDKRIRIIRQENKERGAARNNGLRNASGEYVIFFDSDDRMHANHLQVLHDYIVKLNYPEFLATKFDFIDEKGKSYSSDISFLHEDYYDYHLFLNGNPLACNVCVKKNNPNLKLFEEDRKYAIKEDWMFLLENLYTQRIFIIDKVTITMYDHGQRSMRSGNEEIIRRTQLAYEWIVNRIPLVGEEKKTLQSHIAYFSGIHAYLDDKKRESMSNAIKAIRLGGPKPKYISLLLKSMIGRKIISRLK
jgi:glycosyltransferase involved in cell wall biosynthesis